MEKVSVALCVPTYERSDIVEDFLANCSAYYIEAGIDIYYYDSSVSDKTKDIVCEWPDQEHIHYIRMPSDLHANAKAYKIFQGYGFEKSYDFIWLSGDAYQCSKPAIEQLMPNLNLEYDIVEVCREDLKNVGTRVFTDPNEYMQLCIHNTGVFGAIILNTHTMLNGVDWAYYEKKFLVEPLISYSHISFYFYRILELDRFCAFCLSMTPRLIRYSKLKIESSWIKNYFYIQCEGFVQTIKGLPDYYTNKEQVLTDARTLPIKNIYQFYRYKEFGIYSMRIFLKYRAVWNVITPFPKWKLFLIALVPRPLVKAFRSLRRTVGRTRLQKFCAAHKRIVIYGTGFMGDLYARYFDHLGLAYEAFCVSRRKSPQQENLHRPVYEFSELKHMAGNIGFVIAMEERNAVEVLPAVQEAVSNHDIFCNLKFSENILTEEIFRAKDQLW